MNIHSTDVHSTCRIPVERVAEARSSFSACSLSFEVEFEADGLVALSDLVLLINRSGLTCDHLKYCSPNRIMARLCDSRSANLQLLDADLATQVSIRLVRWTNVVSRRSS